MWYHQVCKDLHQTGTIKCRVGHSRQLVMGYKVTDCLSKCYHQPHKKVINIHFSIAAVFDLGKRKQVNIILNINFN